MNLKAKIKPIIQQPLLHPKQARQAATIPTLLRLAHLCQYPIRTVQTRQLKTIQKSFCESDSSIDLNLTL